MTYYIDAHIKGQITFLLGSGGYKYGRPGVIVLVYDCRLVKVVLFSLPSLALVLFDETWTEGRYACEVR